MSKIAILDTGISPRGLHCKTFRSYPVCRREYEEPRGRASHGTICARILDEFASDYELIGIQILPNDGEDRGKPMGLIEHLREGLLLCRELDPQIICLSAVTSILSDSKYLYPIARELSKRQTIVAALDNQRYMTIPTCYPFVAGVQADIANHLQPGEAAYYAKDRFYARIYANCGRELLRPYHCSPSNSFAVPVAAARINEWINQGVEVKAALRTLRPYPGEEGAELLTRDEGLRQDLPVVAIWGAEERETYAACRSAIEALHARHQVQACALCSLKMEYDIRFRRLSVTEPMIGELFFMEYHYKTDLIFIAVREHERDKLLSQVTPDMEIRILGSSACFLYEDQQAQGSVQEIADKIVQILQ